MRALVTGGAGFIGSHLVDALVEDGIDVVVVDNLASGWIENVSSRAELIEGDVADPELMAKAIVGCEVVFHQAGLEPATESIEGRLDTDQASVHGTVTVLDAARRERVRRVVLASSSSVYGSAKKTPLRESARLVPRSPQAVSKLAAEHYARVAWELYDLETVCLRYFNVYGPRQRHDSPDAAVIPRFVDALTTGSRPVVHGDGQQSRDFTFVADAVQATLRAAQAPAAKCAGKAFNVALGLRHTLLDLLEVLGRLVGTPADPVHVEPRPNDIRHAQADIIAARSALGYEPATTVEQGLAATLSWFMGLELLRGEDSVRRDRPSLP